MMTKGYTCWLLDMVERDLLLTKFPPEYPRVIAHHVTMDHGVTQAHPLPTQLTGRIIGDAFDKGVQALVVEIDGTELRPDGEIFHITWSIDWDRYPENSKQLLKKGWFPLEEPIDIKLTPAFVLSRPV